MQIVRTEKIQPVNVELEIWSRSRGTVRHTGKHRAQCLYQFVGEAEPLPRATERGQTRRGRDRPPRHGGQPELFSRCCHWTRRCRPRWVETWKTEKRSLDRSSPHYAYYTTEADYSTLLPSSDDPLLLASCAMDSVEPVPTRPSHDTANTKHRLHFHAVFRRTTKQ